MKRRDTGILGEKLAKDFLRKKGYHILEINYRCPEGDIDIITQYIEVRIKKNREFGSHKESITPTKIARLRAMASHFRQTHDNLPPLWRIDVVAVELNQQGELSRIELIENAMGDV